MKLLIALAIVVMAASGANAQKLTDPNPWTGQNYTPPCPLTLSGGLLSPSATSCAAGASYGVHIQTATLTTNATLKFPTGLKDGSFVTFRIAQDATGGRSLTLNGGGPIAINTLPSTVSVFTCYGYGGTSPNFTSTQIECGPVSTGLNVGNTSTALANGTYQFSSAGLAMDDGYNGAGGIIGDFAIDNNPPNPNQRFGWNGTKLAASSLAGQFVAENASGNAILNTTGDTFTITQSGSGYIIKNSRTGHFLQLTGTVQAAPGSLAFGATQTIWTPAP